jgi:predicted deacylase
VRLARTEGGVANDEQAAWAAVEPGTKAAFTLAVAVRADGSAVALPLLVVRGAAPGRTLFVSAGVHGDEFEGMACLWRLFDELRPADVAGTLAAVTVANPPAYEAAARCNPDDRQDMARVFPGDPRGTVTEQLACALTHRCIAHADFYCDLHSAGQYYAMPPLAGYQLRPEPLLGAQRAAARAFGLPLIWGTPGYPGRSLSAAADLGVPALYVEITGEGRCRAADVEAYLHGLRRLLAHLGLTRGADAAPEPRRVIEDDGPQSGFLQVQNRAAVGGFFAAEVAVAETVRQGQRLGVIRDALGAVRQEVFAPRAGLVVFLRTFPRVLAGDALVTVA